MLTRKEEKARLSSLGVVGSAAEALLNLNAHKRHNHRVAALKAALMDPPEKADGDVEASKCWLTLRAMTYLVLDAAGVGGHGGWEGIGGERLPVLKSVVPGKNAPSAGAWQAAMSEVMEELKQDLKVLRKEEISLRKASFGEEFHPDVEAGWVSLSVYPACEAGRAWLSYRWLHKDKPVLLEHSVELSKDLAPWVWSLAMKVTADLMDGYSLPSKDPLATSILVHQGHVSAWAALANWAKGEHVEVCAEDMEMGLGYGMTL